MEMKSTLCLVLVAIAFLAAMASSVDAIGCPAVDGKAFAPYTGPGRFTIPKAKSVEISFEKVIENYIALKLRGGFARSIFQKPNDLRDYAYEASKIMSLEGEVFFANWPVGCVAPVTSGDCDWDYYRTARKHYIQDVHSIDFMDTGFPLQDKTGGKGYCVDKVQEFYGHAGAFSPTALIADVFSNEVTTGDELFPDDGVVAAAGPHIYGVGVYTATQFGATTFWLTIIRVTLITSPPCTCALGPCTP